MTILAKITKSVIDALKNRMVTAMGINVVSATEVAPAGVDCPPTANMLGLYMTTDKRNSPVFIGYVNSNLLADPGERRIFATDASGAEVSRIWLYDKVEIGGTGPKGSNVNHAVQWEALNYQLQNQLVNFINSQLPAIAAGIASAGGSYTPGTMTLDITPAKEDTILIP